MAGVSSSRAHNETYRQLRPSNTPKSCTLTQPAVFQHQERSHSYPVESHTLTYLPATWSSAWAQGLALGVPAHRSCRVNIGLAWSLDFGAHVLNTHTHTHTHSLSRLWISFTVQIGVTPGHHEEVITTLVHTLKFKIKTSFTSCSNNNLQTGFNLHTHTHTHTNTQINLEALQTPYS